jgi:hypothetical protein
VRFRLQTTAVVELAIVLSEDPYVAAPQRYLPTATTLLTSGIITWRPCIKHEWGYRNPFRIV